MGQEEQLRHARYKRWVELDENQAKVWRYAWDLLLEDRLTLEQICEKLHERGYRLRDGKPFIEIKKRGQSKAYIQQLSRAFHNWFYAGWVVADNDWAKVPPKTVRGEWEPIVSTEEFERGLEILARRHHLPVPTKRHFYLLQGLVYLEDDDGSIRKLTCGKPNANRARGGVSYYCIPSSNQNFLCHVVDEQMPVHLEAIQISPDLLPLIRQAYLSDVARYTCDHDRERQELDAALNRLELKEVNLWRAFTEHGMRAPIYEKLSREYEDERIYIQRAIQALQQDQAEYITNLDSALMVIAEIADHYLLHTPQRQRDILKQMVSRVVINPEGRIVRIEWKPPFDYLDGLRHSGKKRSRGKRIRPQNKETSDVDAGSPQIIRGDPERTRTSNQLIKSQLLCQLSYGAAHRNVPQLWAPVNGVLRTCGAAIVA